MKRVGVLTVLLVVAVLVAALPAGAAVSHQRHHRARPRAWQDPVAMALTDAFTYWRRAPCHGQVAVRVAPLAIGEYAEASATGMVAEPDGSYNPAAAAAFTDCSIALAASVFGPDSAHDPLWQIQGYYNWQDLCVVVTHEVGHLLGYGHSADRGSVMYPGETVANEPLSCQAHWPWEGRGHP